MSIEFFGVGGPPNVGGPKKTLKPETGKADAGSKADQVEFSSILKDVHNAQAASSTAETERAARVQQLKEQVAGGSYEPDLQKVATSLLQFLVENK